MTTYIVHLYREMRLIYTGIDAETPQAAAALVKEKATADADNIEDCEGQTLAALVDTAGDDDYSQSVTFDFDEERIRNAPASLLAILETLADQADEDCPGEYRSRHFVEALQAARDAVLQAKAAGILSELKPDKPSPRFVIEHDPQEDPDRAYVRADETFDVAIIRTDEGIVIDVYPNGWMAPIDTMTVWNDDVVSAGEV